MFPVDPHMPISPSAMSLSRSIFFTSSLSRNKKSPFLVDKKGLELSIHPTLSSKVSLPCWS